MSCVSEIDFCIIRGDQWTKDVGLTASYAEVLENPQDWQAAMVFREYQDDDLAPYLTLTAAPNVNPDPLINEVAVMFYFTATPMQTQALPEWDIVGYTELQFIGPAVPGSAPVSRLFNSKVQIND